MSAPSSTPTTDRTDHSLAFVRGVLSRAPERRDLPSGDHVVAFDITTRPVVGPAESVPVVWPGAPDWSTRLQAGERVVVVGRVRRRFFRAGGATASRTEVLAERLAPAGHAARAARVVARVHEHLEAIDAGAG